MPERCTVCKKIELTLVDTECRRCWEKAKIDAYIYQHGVQREAAFLERDQVLKVPLAWSIKPLGGW